MLSLDFSVKCAVFTHQKMAIFEERRELHIKDYTSKLKLQDKR